MSNFGFDTTGAEVVSHFQDRVARKTILITGSSASGLGAETALSLAHGSPSQLILLARSPSKVESVTQEIHKIDEAIQVFFIPVELDKASSVSNAVAQIRATSSIKKIDIIINNAGVMASPWSKNDAGIESQLATNHVGHFLLTKGLQPLVASAGKGARIINLTSDGYMISPFRFDDYNFSDGATYDRWSGYGQSKTDNILFTRYLASKLAKHGISAFTVHPGVIMTTSLGRDVNTDMFADIPAIAERNTGSGFEVGKPKTPQQGVATTLVAALDPTLDGQSGSYLSDCQVAPVRDYASSSENAEKLWKLSEELTGEPWDLDKW